MVIVAAYRKAKPWRLNAANQVPGCAPAAVGTMPRLVLLVMGFLHYAFSLVVCGQRQAEDTVQPGEVSVIEMCSWGVKTGEARGKQVSGMLQQVQLARAR